MKSTISTKTIGNLLLADNTVTGALFRMGVVQFWCSFDILIGFWINEWIESKRSFHVSYRTPTEDDFKLFDKQSNGGGHGKSSGTNFLLICSKFKQFPSKRQVYFCHRLWWFWRSISLPSNHLIRSAFINETCFMKFISSPMALPSKTERAKSFGKGSGHGRTN